MKRNLLRISISLAMIAIASLTWAHDIIVTADSKKIDAKILEVSKSEIKYKEIDNLDGPIFIIDIQSVSSIIYSNGKVVLYNELDKDLTPVKKAITSEKEEMISDTKRNSEKQGNIGGICWSLAGRKVISLPKPSTDFNQEGKVVVVIQVNEKGSVVSAKYSEGTTITDKYTIQLAIDAALKAKFSPSSNKLQIGTITYTFKLN